MTGFRTRFLSVPLLALCVAGCGPFVSAPQRIARARTAIGSGDWGLATVEIQKALQRAPEDPTAWMLLARVSLLSGETAGAQADLAHAMKDGARGPEADQLRIDIWLAANRPQAVLDALARNDVHLPEPDRSLALARAYDALEQPDQAMAALAPILALRPPPAGAEIEHARALSLLGRSAEALTELETARAADPGTAGLLEGRIYASRGQYSQAEQAMRRALDGMAGATPLADRALAWAVITESRLALGRVADAARSAAALSKLVPGSAAARLLSARVLLARGDYLEGVTALQGVVAGSPAFVPALMALGAAQLEQGNLMQAQAHLSQVVQLAPDNLEARKLLARARLQLDEPGQALAVLTPALGGTASDPELEMLLGAASSRIGRAAAGLEPLERAASAQPENADLQLDLARAQLLAGQAAKALAVVQATAPGKDAARREAILLAALSAARSPGAAATELHRYLEARIGDVTAMNLAAAFYASQYQYIRAQGMLSQALALKPHDLATLTRLAGIDIACADLPGAERALRAALAAGSQDVNVRIALAHLIMRRGDFAEAQRLLSEKENGESSPKALLALAQLHLAGGDLAQASAELDRAIGSAHDAPQLVAQAGVLLMESRHYDAALARFRHATELAPEQAAYWLESGRAQLALDHPAAAEESFRKALQLRPLWEPAVEALTLVDLRAKRYDAALARVREALAKRPEDAEALELEGDVQVAAGHPQAAVDAYDEAQNHRPAAQLSVKLYATERAAHQPHPEKSLQSWLAIQPNDYRVRTVLANDYLEKRAWKAAEEQFQAVIRQDPYDVMALNNLAVSYQQLGDPRAEATAERAHLLAPSSSDVADTLGWILAGTHAEARALPLLEQAAHGASDNPEIQFHYAYVLAQLGKRTEARAVLSRVLAGKQRFEGRQEAERLLARL